MSKANLDGLAKGLDELERCTKCGLSWQRLDENKLCPQCDRPLPLKVQCDVCYTHSAMSVQVCAACATKAKGADTENMSGINNVRSALTEAVLHSHKQDAETKSQAATIARLADEIAWLRRLVERVPGSIPLPDKHPPGTKLFATGYPGGGVWVWDGKEWTPPMGMAKGATSADSP